PEVKPPSADDSAAACRAKVGNRQAPYDQGPKGHKPRGLFLHSGPTDQDTGSWHQLCAASS
ncbi:hypothetical protein, partial [Methyloglobulus morosus]|uniref:hypothetical protein n=1 Tax=Methyloglobulus morosus TaxID=1410681 RepID=UPI000568CBD6